MLIWSVFSLALALSYAVLMFVYWYGWQRQASWSADPGWRPGVRVTVIIPARNEAANIGPCLHSLRQCAFPADLLEVLVVDDHSDDGTAQAAREAWPAATVLRLSEYLLPGEAVHSHKKRAIEVAARQARGALLVCLDADCTVSPGWLRQIAALYEARRPAAIVGPVAIARPRGLCGHFQALDVAGLMAVTAAGLRLGFQRMGNGANLAYPRAVFGQVNGFEGNTGRASGDDLFLLQKIERLCPGKIVFLKNPEAVVHTLPEPGWRALWRQRLRWGTKNAALPEWPIRLALAGVFLFCCTILVNTAFAWASPAARALLACQLGTKAAFDLMLLHSACAFLDRRAWLRWFLPAFAVHTVYIVAAGVASLTVRQYPWKGRRVR